MWTFFISLALANPHLEAGKAAMAQKNYQQAIVSFQNCIKSDPKNIDCNWEIGWAYWMKEDWNSVIKHWKTVQKLDPEHNDSKQYLPQAEDQYNLIQLINEKKSQVSKKIEKPAVSKVATSIRIRAVGDMMIGTAFPQGYLPPNNGKDSFTDVKSILQDADVTFGNLEGPICGPAKSTKCRPGSPPGRCYAFRSPPSYVNVYKDAGFDVVSTANNHAVDFGHQCRLQTERLLDKAGIKHSGRPGDIAYLTVKGLKVALIGFHTSRSGHYLNDHNTAKKLISSLAKKHDIILVSFHGGREGSSAMNVPNGREIFLGENRGHLRKFARDVIDAGADAVIGHGPHILRGMEIYKNRLIAYSLGNFATYGRFSLKGAKSLGAILEIQVNEKGEFTGGKIFPTKQQGRGVPFRDPENRAIGFMKKLSEQDFGKTAVRIDEQGNIQKP